jgi:uncharacterized BrkB/YihY/UPF0761 family membrane protein
VYYSCQILLFGTEFTRVYAQRHGANARPESYAKTDFESQGVEPAHLILAKEKMG